MSFWTMKTQISLKPLTVKELFDVGQIISENVVTVVSEFSVVLNENCIHQILKGIPVMYLLNEAGGVF